ncbi:peptidase C39 family protein [Microbacterium sp. HD4P20]|uniref:peptidase C39 family protein n=1 Tax=Microbacterium sp. HD4P20 TaxID=2864874 RepID=UPI001C63F6AA|nr:peptidase C39 family protein [Microbacterium sp. HD4P20]MCP2635218.1 peptidase C39 family protein [Microbacterium sp. HD4P20]
MPATLRDAAGISPVDIADELEAHGLTATRAARWRLSRSGYRPASVVIRDDAGAPVAAALTSGRPSTAATKIIDLWWRDETAAAQAVDAVVEGARDRGDVAVKWEVVAGEGVPAFGVDRGFVAMRRPWAAVGTEAVGGYVLWLDAVEHDEPGYYAQTTLFTCGAVAALIASEGRAPGGFDGSAGDRDREIAFWRSASNYPACEPIGLAVALHDRVAGVSAAAVEVALDLEGPALLEGFEGFDHSFRAELQADSLRQAIERGIPVRRDRIAVTEIAERVAGGERALLLIDEAAMHGEVGPHWIVAHAVAGGAVVVEDPWINVEAGETWVDTHELPIHLADLDVLVRWSDEAYRGVIFV